MNVSLRKSMAAMVAAYLLSTSPLSTAYASSEPSNQPLNSIPYSVLNRPHESFYECYVAGDSAFQLFGLTKPAAVELIRSKMSDKTVYGFIENSMRIQNATGTLHDYLDQIKTGVFNKDWLDNRMPTGQNVPDYMKSYGLLAALAHIQGKNLYIYTQGEGGLQLNHVLAQAGKPTLRALLKPGNKYNKLVFANEIVLPPAPPALAPIVIDLTDDEPVVIKQEHVNFELHDISRIVDGQSTEAEINNLKQYLLQNTEGLSGPYYQMILARLYIEHGTAAEAQSLISSMKEIIDAPVVEITTKHWAYVYLGKLYISVGDYDAAGDLFFNRISDRCPLSYYYDLAQLLLDGHYRPTCCYTGVLMNDDEIFDYVEKLLDKQVRTTNKTDSLTNLSAPLYLSHAKQQAKLPELRALLETRRNQLFLGSVEFETPVESETPVEPESSVAPEVPDEVPALSDDLSTPFVNRKRDRSGINDLEDESEDEESALKQTRALTFEPTELSDSPLLESTSSSSSSQSLNRMPEYTRAQQMNAIELNIKDAYNRSLPEDDRIQHFRDALFALDEMGDSQDLTLRARALIGLGNLRYSNSSRTGADWYLEALHILDVLPRSDELISQRAITLIGLGNVRYSIPGRTDADWYLEALRILPRSGHFIGLRARALIGLGNASYVTPLRSWGSWYQEAFDLVKNIRGLEVLRDRAHRGMKNAQRLAESRR